VKSVASRNWLVRWPICLSYLTKVNKYIMTVFRSASDVLISAMSIKSSPLDIETFRLAFSGDQMDAVRKLSAADLQRVAARLFKDAAVATAVVGDYEQLKASFGPIELRKEKPDVKAATDPAAPAKKP